MIAKRVGSLALAAALLTACNTSSSGTLIVPPPTSSPPPNTSKTFLYTNGPQHFKVPAGVTKLEVTVDGAQGGGSTKGYGYRGSLGAEVAATISVHSGERFVVFVGGRGVAGAGGFNGGAAGAYGGGGSSDVRTGAGRLRDRIIVAAGGGGTGETFHFMGISSYYWCYGGRGGQGGAGAGDAGGYGDCGGGGGGGGGGGYGGGGGGGGGGCCNIYGGGGAGGGGGGGASYVEPNAKNVHRTKGGGPKGDGVVIFSW